MKKVKQKFFSCLLKVSSVMSFDRSATGKLCTGRAAIYLHQMHSSSSSNSGGSVLMMVQTDRQTDGRPIIT